MTNEPWANKDSVLIKTSTAQPGGGWRGLSQACAGIVDGDTSAPP